MFKLNTIDNSIEVVPEAEQLRCIIALKEVLKKDKDYFKKSITYIYHVYKRDHPYENNPTEIRKKKVCGEYLQGMDSEIFERDLLVQAVIKEYKENEYTSAQWFLLGIKNDINKLKEIIQSIPWTKEIVYDGFIDYQGEKVKIHQIITIDNSKEKVDALDRIKKLLEVEELLKSKAIKEQREKKQSHNYLFDRSAT